MTVERTHLRPCPINLMPHERHSWILYVSGGSVMTMICPGLTLTDFMFEREKIEKNSCVLLGYRVYGPEGKLLFESRSYAEMFNFVLRKRKLIKPLKVVEAYRKLYHVEIVEEEIDVFWEHAHEKS